MKYNGMKRNGIEWSGMGWSGMNKIDGKWWYEMKFIPSYSILLRSIPLLFFKSKQCNIIIFHSTPLHSIIFHQSKRSLSVGTSHFSKIDFYDCKQTQNRFKFSLKSLQKNL
jgi:hypothetical protein